MDEAFVAVAEALRTTDSRAKWATARADLPASDETIRTVTVSGVAKGVGMIHPNMATMLAFIATDAALSRGFVRTALKRVVDRTFNMITVDGDTSTNDSCFLLANGLAGNAPIEADDAFEAADQEGSGRKAEVTGA